MKAALLLGAILLISLVMVDAQSKTPPDPKNIPSSGKNEGEPTTSKTTTPPSTGTMVYGGPVFFLLPLMWMVVHLLHM